MLKGRVKGNEYTFRGDDSIKYFHPLSEMGLALKGSNLLPFEKGSNLHGTRKKKCLQNTMSLTICLPIQNTKVGKGHNTDKTNHFFFQKLIRLIVSNKPTCFKLLAQIVTEISCLQNFNASLYKGHNSKNFFSKVNLVIYLLFPISSAYFKAVAQIVFEITC